MLAAALVLAGLYTANPNFIPFVVATLLAGVFSCGLFADASYWAFKFRQILPVRIYRNQALGIGLVAFGWILIFIDNILFNGEIFTAYIPFFIINVSVLILLFYFIDASILAGRRSDPLLRDTLHWRKLRIVLWILNFLVGAVIIALVIYYQITTGNEPQFMLVYGGF